MSRMGRAAVIVPARNEVETIGQVVAGLRSVGAGRFVVVDNASTDGTAIAASEGGAQVVVAPRKPVTDGAVLPGFGRPPASRPSLSSMATGASIPPTWSGSSSSSDRARPTSPSASARDRPCLLISGRGTD